MNLNPFVFQDKASFILRAMLRERRRPWVARDFVKECGLSIGLASKVLKELRNGGFIKGTDRGRLAEAVLRNEDEIVKQWTNFYKMEKNKAIVLYAEEEDILNRLRIYFKNKSEKEVPYALTLHSGANLMTGYVRDSNMYFYLRPTRFKETVLKLREALNLKELKQGGNIFIYEPHYKNSAFFGLRSIKGFPVVSDLQLYLDLYNFPHRGLEQAEILAKTLDRKGKNLG